MRNLIYLLIFVAKVLEVTIATTRIVLITRGEKVLGACIGFIEVLLWVFLVSTVLTNITEDPIKVLVYALGFSVGNYVGSVFEQKLGLGNVRLEAIVKDEHGEDLANRIRERGYAVTILEGKGKDCARDVLVMHIKRKKYQNVVNMIKELQYSVVITVNDIRPVYGGYGILRK